MSFVCKSSFCVINNPCYDIVYKHDETGALLKDDLGKPVILTQTPTEYYGLTEQQICDDILNKWIAEDEENTGAVLYCVSAVGLHHLHCVFESKKAYRPLNVLKRLFPKIHIEITKGNKKQVEDYINKSGAFLEKGEEIIAKSQVGDLVGCQGKRTDLIKMTQIKELIEEGKTSKDIFIEYPSAMKSEKIVHFLFNEHKKRTVPLLRDIHVSWLCGSTGCGKSYIYVQLCEEFGEDNVYLVSDYKSPFDNYNGQDIIVFDEFRGQFRLAEILMYLQGYRQEIHCRYSNKIAFWTKVYITSPVTPFELYKGDEDTMGRNDKLQQLYRRIDDIIYCFKHDLQESTFYFQYKFPCDINQIPKELYSSFYDCKKYYSDKVLYDINFNGDDLCVCSKTSRINYNNNNSTGGITF